MKNKTTAVILAVIFGQWTWLYTYKKDAWKFWTGTATIILTAWLILPPLAIWLWALIDAAAKNENWYKRYHKKGDEK